MHWVWLMCKIWLKNSIKLMNLCFNQIYLLKSIKSLPLRVTMMTLHLRSRWPSMLPRYSEAWDRAGLRSSSFFCLLRQTKTWLECTTLELEMVNHLHSFSSQIICCLCWKQWKNQSSTSLWSKVFCWTITNISTQTQIRYLWKFMEFIKYRSQILSPSSFW